MTIRDPKNRIEIILGDITRQKVEAIVNAANPSLLGGGGVDGAIHRAAGPHLLEECRKLHGCKTGSAKITGGYDLLAEYVIHTVGPIWRGGNHDEHRLLADCYRNSLELSKEYKLRSVAFPSISTGAYGFPVEGASHVAISEILRHLEQNQYPEKVFIICFDVHTYEVYCSALFREASFRTGMDN